MSFKKVQYAVLAKQVAPKLQPALDADIVVQYSSIQHLTVAHHKKTVLESSLPKEANAEHQPNAVLFSPSHCLSLPPLPPCLATKPADSQNEVSIKTLIIVASLIHILL